MDEKRLLAIALGDVEKEYTTKEARELIMAIIADDTEVVHPTVGLEPVDMEYVKEMADKVRHLIDIEDEETIEGDLEYIDSTLSNDERIELATLLKESSPEGTRKTYVSVYNEWLRRADVRIK